MVEWGMWEKIGQANHKTRTVNPTMLRGEERGKSGRMLDTGRSIDVGSDRYFQTHQLRLEFLHIDGLLRKRHC